MSSLLDLDRLKPLIAATCAPLYRGRISNVSGMLVEATGVPAAVGELCRIQRSKGGTIDAEVVGFRGDSTLLMPHGDVQGIAPMQEVVALGRPFSIAVGNELLGRTLDGLGRPMDGGASVHPRDVRAVRAESPEALSRPPIVETLQTGVRVIDGLNTIGRGQRIGIFAGSGVGKSTLLGQITRGTDADITVVCLVGERGREVGGFVHEVLGAEGMKKAVLVVATSDRSPIERYMAPFVAMTVAEHFRDQGLNVLMVMDSVTRFALAAREIGLAAGEPPTVRGFPPSFFATIPKLVERMGRTQQGSITGLLTVLVDGDDPNEPVSDTLRGLLDGHIHLSRSIAQSGTFPAVDVLQSLSRLMPALATREEQQAANFVRSCLAAWKEGKDLVEIGAYRAGTNPRLDTAIAHMEVIQAFLRQDTHEHMALSETRELLRLIHGAKAS